MRYIISDSKPLEPDFIPPELPHREREMKTLDRTFTSLIKGKSAVNVKPDYVIKDISGLLECLI
jgi:Cdc6-like AAA superfamily ATPase